MKITRTTTGILFSNFEKKQQGCIAVKYYKKSKTEEITYTSFIADIKKTITWLNDKKISVKKTAVLGDYNYDWLVSLYSIMCAGGTAIPLDKDLSANELSNMIFLADAEYVFYEKKYNEVAQQIHETTGISIICYDEEDHMSEVSGCNGEKAVFCNDENKVAMFLYTSGTTGQNKVVMITHKNLYSTAYGSRPKIYGELQKIFLAVPLCHGLGIIALVITLFGGDTVCLNEDIRYVTRNFNLFDPTVIYTVPMIAKGLCNYIRNTGNSEKNISLKLIVSVGAALDPQITYQYEKMGICAMQAYGLTESLFATCNSVKWHKAESVGQTDGLSNIKFVENEIWISGDSICAGYYNNETENKKIFVNGWLKTGDIGCIDEDGFVYITGRIKNLIIRDDGNNVSPEEMEQRITNSIPYIQEVIVKLIDNKLTAEVYCGDNDSDFSQKIVKDIESLNYELPEYKVIEKIVLRDTPFEKTSTQKIKRS